MDSQPASANPPTKTPIHRGARACTVCRQAKMKCVGAEDGTKRCQRCQRSGAECIFEKHRRGRKPGSKLSEASKMLRRLEKGLNNAKAKQPSSSALSQASASLPHYSQDDLAAGPSSYNNSNGSHTAQQSDDDMEEDEEDHTEDAHGAIYPAKAIRSSIRTSFLDVVMNKDVPAELSPPHPSTPSDHPSLQQPKALSQSPTRSRASPQPLASGLFPLPKDPVSAGYVTESCVSTFFDAFFLRLNPFINLFDPALHTPDYVRSKSPFLFTTILMACCKFFQPASYQSVRRLAQEWCVYTFAEGTENVETVQALACMTYWKDPHDHRTWTYIGMACRMAVNLRLNRYVGPRLATETDAQHRERRNRERTYLVLFVHDRSLSMQTGKHWMLPEDELIRRSGTWHKEGASGTRSETIPVDVIVAAFVNLRLIGSAATDTFYNRTSMFDKELHGINVQLDAWLENWIDQMRECPLSHPFHVSFLQFFQSHVRLFLNTFGLNMIKVEMSRTMPNEHAVRHCFLSARTNLTIVSRDFAATNVLRYCQESITVMSAYAAIVLLKVSVLLRHPSTMNLLRDNSDEIHAIHAIINQTADAYQNAGQTSGSEVDSAAHHARFLRRLTAMDIEKARQHPERNGLRQDGLPPSFAQGLPPIRATQPTMGNPVPHLDGYSYARTGAQHGVSPSQLPPLTIPGSSSQSPHAFSSPGHVDYGMDSAMRTGLSQGTGRAGLSYTGMQTANDSDDSYFNYMLNEVNEHLFPRNDAVPTSTMGFMSNGAVPDYSSYPSHPPQVSPYGAHTHSRPSSYLPSIHPYSNGFDGSR